MVTKAKLQMYADYVRIPMHLKSFGDPFLSITSRQTQTYSPQHTCMHYTHMDAATVFPLCAVIWPCKTIVVDGPPNKHPVNTKPWFNEDVKTDIKRDK